MITLQNGRQIGDGYPVFVIAEVGSNWVVSKDHDINVKTAKQHIDAAVEAGADAVKFQVFTADTVYVKNAGKSDYLSETRFSKDINEIFNEMTMPYEMLPILKEYCDQKKILFMASPFSVAATKKVDEFVQIHKLASYEMNHIRLLDAFAECNKPIIVSTGAHTLEEVELTISYLRNKGVKDICITQCTACYPAPFSALNLNTIPVMKVKFGVPVGLSDHSSEAVTGPVSAVALGANIIEKHFTLDRNLPGPDQKYALEPQELRLMIKSIRNAEQARGTGIKEILPAEEELRAFAVRGIQATTDLKKGEMLKENFNISILRSGKNIRGMNPMLIDKISGKKVKRDIPSGEGIQEGDVE